MSLPPVLLSVIKSRQSSHYTSARLQQSLQPFRTLLSSFVLTELMLPFLFQHYGVPKGNVLSITFFLVAPNGLPFPSLFVDLSAVVVDSPLLPLQLAICNTSCCAFNHCFKVSTTKTCAMASSEARSSSPFGTEVISLCVGIIPNSRVDKKSN